MKYVLTGTETERLKFRLLTENDFNDWLPLFSAERVPDFLGMDPTLTPEELCKKWFEKCMNRYAKNLGGMNVLVDKKSGKMVGQCGLLIQDILGEELMEVGYSILPEYWGKGYASEAAIKCKELGFENDYAKEIISMVHVDNIGSETVAKKNGMTHWRYIEDYKGSPVNIFKITKDEYLSQKK